MRVSTGHLGPTVFGSNDGGRTWTESSRPPAFRTGEPLGRSLTSVFRLTPGHVDQLGVWFAGGSPQGLFATTDDGDTSVPVDGWNDNLMWERGQSGRSRTRRTGRCFIPPHPEPAAFLHRRFGRDRAEVLADLDA